MEPRNTAQRFRVLVSGGTGFVGRHLSLRLANVGCTVHAITRQENLTKGEPDEAGVHWHLYDGTVSSLIDILQQTKPEIVVHLASLFLGQHTSQNLRNLIDSNVLFGTQLLEAMDNSGVRLLLNTGTSWQNYKNSRYSPVNLYAATKQAFEDIALYYCQARNISMITLRLFDTYGLDDSRDKLLPLLKRAARTGELLELSPGEQLIDLVYIDDVVDGFVCACQRLLEGSVRLHEVFALSSGKPISLQELTRLYVASTNKPLNVKWGARPYRNREVMVPWDVGNVLPGWRPKTELSCGLKYFDNF